MKRILCFLCVIQGLPASAEVFKCVDESGKVEFSDSQCAENAESIDIKNSTTGISFKGGDISRVIKANKSRENARETRKEKQYLNQLKSDLKALEETKKATIAGIDNQLKFHFPKDRGEKSEFKARLVENRRAAVKQFDEKIAALQKQINKLKAKIFK